MSKQITYNEALAQISELLSNEKNLAQFCREKKLSYQIAMKIKNNKSNDRKYPKEIVKFFKAYNIKSEYVKQYNILFNII